MAYTGKTLQAAYSWLMRLPDGIFFSTEPGGVEFQPDSRRPAEVLRGLIGQHAPIKGPWTEERFPNWWEYHNETLDGLHIRIYADHQGPKSCVKVT